jgi:outer membrane protein OmpA-like peptidoglycan-associated protein
MSSSFRRLFLLVAICLAGSGTALAQSHDAAKPAPLGPGVNKGNIDNFGGSHYYYFYAGPGHIDIDFAFKEMGMLGQPFRQSLDIDFIREDGQLGAHNSLTSFGTIERGHMDGDIDHRQKFTMVVTAQKGLVKLGGYYEIALKGAVSFEGATASGNVAPQQSEALVTPGGPLVQPAGPLVQPAGPLVTPGDPLVQPGGPLVKQVGPLLVSELPKEVRVTLPADVLFDFDKAIIRGDAVPALQQAAAMIREKRRGKVVVEGHTDSKGGDAYNMRLSQARAEAVESWLIRNGGFESRDFSTVAFGARRPMAPNTTQDGRDNPDGRQRNRRVELVIAK